MDTNTTHPLAYPVATAGPIIGVSRSTLYELIAAGRIRSFKIGSKRLVTHQALQDFLDAVGTDAEVAS